MAVGTVLFVFLLAFFSLGIYTRHGSGIQVPQLQTLPIDKAIALLKAQNLEYKIDSVYVPDEKPGSVVQQDPDPGTMVKENRTIYLGKYPDNGRHIGRIDTRFNNSCS